MGSSADAKRKGQTAEEEKARVELTSPFPNQVFFGIFSEKIREHWERKESEGQLETRREGT